MAQDDLEDKQGSGAKQTREVDSMLDTSETSRASQKVELDLDDAPFLEEEEEVKEEPQAPKASVSLESAEPKAPPMDKRKKLMIIGAAALLLLLITGVTVKLLFFKAAPAPPPQQTDPAADQANASEEAPPELPELQFRMEPFLVEQNAGNEEIRFLTVRILLGTKDPSVLKDIQVKMLPARNAIFYYLKNKDVQFLTDENNVDKLKAELLLVINQYVSDGKFDTLLFEEYVVK